MIPLSTPVSSFARQSPWSPWFPWFPVEGSSANIMDPKHIGSEAFSRPCTLP
jgi:hypothetical protein